ncbi:DUF2919 domain-containing protein [Pseudoalteromonas luteoviolacea]|uniref:DUF2919 domain-containing protein n=1 Tax=Pseudoalteromonas luteoviolacea DSM 6061 TaxID=1365250 RepID=A0A166UEC7_9GAMM|nr:DUF2919 domain-containing protein [Pseudoalteromonas luteoviolacea]KZN29880.1 hypothetical protein N475_25020 [Pseudoalteromonas luteoviolacea DSM 6061]MBE0387179.1 hypothetical protein [Pseudoalteromonas luteoviolacea DSM 6061]TQF72019.1 DUF2919 domain-containing protein [Pseudoalteromonas luteoviolacea]
MSKLQGRFGPEYWDKYGVYKTPLGFNLTLIVLLRPFLIWLMSALTWRPDLDIMSLFFPSKDNFFIAIGIGSIALLPALVFSMRRPTSTPRWGDIWGYMRWPLLIAALLDLAWLLMQAANGHYQFSFYLASQIVLVSWVLLYLINSRYLTCFFSDWPEPEAK